MKTFKFKKTSLLLGTLLLASMSCSDEFLQVAPTDSLADAQVSTKAGIDGLLIGTYSALNGVFGNRFEGPNHWATGSIVGGEANKGTDAGDYSSLNPIQRYEASPVDPNNDFNSLWRGRYEGISRANKVLSAIANSTELSAADAARLSGEARMLRGHFYFDLKKHFNNIVVFDETVPAEDLALLPNNGDAWTIIESDLQYAYDNLPGVNGAGRVNKWAAAALMGKAKLFQQKFGEAKTWFDDVIANGVTSNGIKYALLDDYSQIFNAENDNHAEVVFDVESSNNTGSVNNANWFDDLNYPYNTGPDGPGNCCGFFQPSFEMANSYRTGADGLPLLDGSYNSAANAVKNDYGVEADEPFVEDTDPLDPRIDHVIGRRGIPYLDWIEHPGKAWIRDQVYGGPYSPKKYIYYRSQENSFTDGSSWTRGYAIMNYTIIRFADVLLMAAEAEIEAPGGSLDTALEYVNRVRRRAANSEHWVKEYDSDDNAANYVISEYTSFPNADFARDAVRFERKLELGEEGHRFFDLVRWGVAAEELNAYLAYESTKLVTKFGGASFTTGKNEYFPIPQAQIDITGSDVLTQNPGY
ncbi:RagB/SusD family nutrient uptake outer membrane protein [Maribacter hydrothermalis]|uniref:Carbohydrate-binding protein SusD n=1 Tax=Maribacter hydrothermalis TaxID=1836467 RepID=A0A1B7ZD86_9FLAO|nr:RagB/SusD family nutrient uptake outer membrane protein [Maribacter hydrothermalis]APQ18476.1 RagB/SusD family nutrient uptake outer membrane protein [Maribacter hydrothermalis]OBR41317.1 carbohydrate-binding protein SusD [Maribacter hydrothermalis]